MTSSPAYTDQAAWAEFCDIPGNGWIYFIQAGDDGPVKIGFARNLPTCLSAVELVDLLAALDEARQERDALREIRRIASEPNYSDEFVGNCARQLLT